ncbi:putative lipase [Bradyrhizobium japonicum]|nr:putative lipase [Bradyrhizobium japonicum]
MKFRLATLLLLSAFISSSGGRAEGAGPAQPIDQYEIRGNVIPYESVYPAELETIRQSCQWSACRSAHAVIFVHGIFGGDDTFRNGNFDWRRNLPEQIDGSAVDVYSVKYHTQLFKWLGKHISSLDEVVYALYHGIESRVGGSRSFIEMRPYRSIGFIGHSLGGNVAIAYLHTVKTEQGHDERARHAYIITLGAPLTGAQIADVGSWLKERLHMQRDPLLESLQRDNTFLRMLAHWRYSENLKATRFQCRRVHLYLAREGSTMYGVPVVPELDHFDFVFDSSGAAPAIKTFSGRNHESLAKPANKDDAIYKWVDGILHEEIGRVNNWNRTNGGDRLCRRIY